MQKRDFLFIELASIKDNKTKVTAKELAPIKFVS